MANAESLHRHFYREMRLPRTLEVDRHGCGKKRVNWIVRFQFNWWSLRAIFWHRLLGGMTLAYQQPAWIHGWAKHGVLNGFRLFKPCPSIREDQPIPELCRYEHWSDVVLDKDLA